MTDSPSASAGACPAGSSAHAGGLVAGFHSPLTAHVVSASSLLSAEWSQPLVIGGFHHHLVLLQYHFRLCLLFLLCFTFSTSLC